MMIDTFSIGLVDLGYGLDILYSSHELSSRWRDQMQPRGLGIPATRAASLAGPFGEQLIELLDADTRTLAESCARSAQSPCRSTPERMKCSTCQCCSVSGVGTPHSSASSVAISSVHCVGVDEEPFVIDFNFGTCKRLG